MMLRAPPPEMAMALAEEHRRDLMELAGKQPTDGAGHRNPRSFLCVAVAGLAQLVRCLDAVRANPWAASKVASFTEPSSGQRAARSWAEKPSKHGRPATTGSGPVTYGQGDLMWGKLRRSNFIQSVQEAFTPSRKPCVCGKEQLC